MDEVESLQQKIRDLKAALRQHGEIVDDPKCAALCETAAEVANGLESAFEHYLRKSERAWQ